MRAQCRVILISLCVAALVAPVMAQTPAPSSTLEKVFYERHERMALLDEPQTAHLARRAIEHGDVLRRAGDFTGALEAYRESISLSPIREGYYGYGDMLALKGQLSKAADQYRYVLYPLPKPGETWRGALQTQHLFRLALILSAMGRTDEAITAYTRGVDPSGKEEVKPKLNFFNGQRFDHALFQATCHLHLGYWRNNRSDPADPITAADEFRQAVRLKPDFAVAWHHLAYALVRKTKGNYPPEHAARQAEIKREARRAANTYLRLARQKASSEPASQIHKAERWLKEDLKQ